MTQQNDYTIIDKEEYFNDECLPLINELLTKCYNGRMPCFFTVVTKNDENDTKYRSDGFMTGSNNIRLFDDKIKHHMMINGGCVARPAREDVVLDLGGVSDKDDSVF